MYETAVQKDRFTSQFEGVATSFGWGSLSLPKPKLSYIPTAMPVPSSKQFFFAL